MLSDDVYTEDVEGALVETRLAQLYATSKYLSYIWYAITEGENYRASLNVIAILCVTKNMSDNKFV